MRVDAVSEGKKCRQWAPDYVGKPEHPFLLKLAEAFESLARGTENERHSQG